MALTKETAIDRIEVVQNGAVQVRTATIIKDGDEVVSRTFSRHVINPGDDYANESKEVRDICKTVHTKAKISEYKDALKAVFAPL